MKRKLKLLHQHTRYNHNQYLHNQRLCRQRATPNAQQIYEIYDI